MRQSVIQNQGSSRARRTLLGVVVTPYSSINTNRLTVYYKTAVAGQMEQKKALS